MIIMITTNKLIGVQSQTMTSLQAAFDTQFCDCSKDICQANSDRIKSLPKANNFDASSQFILNNDYGIKDYLVY